MSATPTLTTLRNAIVLEVKTALNPTVPTNATTVHGYQRFWKEGEKFRSLFRRVAPDLLPGVFNGWMIWPVSVREVEPDERFRFYLLHKFQIEGIMGVDDLKTGSTMTPAEVVFRDQIETIRDRLRQNTTVFGNREKTNPIVNLDTFESATDQFAGIGIWHAIMTLECEAIENVFV